MSESSENSQKTKQDVSDIFNYALENVLPEPALRRYVKLDEKSNTLAIAGKEYKLKNYDKIFVIGGGKAGRRTGAELVKILGDRITAGVLNVYLDQARESISDKIKLFGADHPTPNEEGVEGAKQMVELLKKANKKTLVIALISGGGSSLMALPVEGICLDDYQDISKLLLTVPATIDEINAVRKHLDPLKGGGMRKFAENAGGFISLVLSDVPVTKTGVVDDTSVIASGPTVGDDSTFESAKKVLTNHGIWDSAPEAVKKYFDENLGKEQNETLPKDSPLLAENKSLYVMIANNDRAMEAARERAEQLGYSTQLIGWSTGSTDDKIKAEVTEEIENIWQVITPHLTNNDNITFGSFSTDGVDGHSDLAGAIANSETLKLAKSKGIDYKKHLANYDSATFFKKLGLDIKTGPSGTNVADISMTLITNPNNAYRKTAIVFGGEATVNVNLPNGQKPGFGGRNTHLTLLAAEKLAQRESSRRLSKNKIKAGLIKAEIAESQIDISDVGCLGYATDVGPISLIPRAVIGVRCHTDVEKAVKFAYENNIPINARGAGSGLPGQSVGAGIVLDMRSMDKMEMIEDHAEGGKIIYAQCGVICTNLNNYLKDFDVFLASYPASTDMATIGGMIANNSSGANSCKLGTTQHQLIDLHVVLCDGSGLWTSEINSQQQPWQKIIELIKDNKETILRDFPRVAKNSSGYNVLEMIKQIESGLAVDWAKFFAHSEGTLGIITEAKLRALPLATKKATCIVFFTDLKEACRAIPEIYNLGASCFDTAVTTNLDLIRNAFPKLNIPEKARVMYIIEFDDLEVQPDAKDASRRIGKVSIMKKQAAAKLIQKQVEDLKQLLKKRYPKTALGFDMATDPETQDAFWLGRRSALQVLYAYDPHKIPLTMIECVVIPRNEKKLLEFITYMDAVFEKEGIVAGMHGHAGDCNFHIYPLLNLSQQQDRIRLINSMTKITQKVTELGGSMSGEHADGRTRGIILPYVFGTDLFDLFVEIKNQMDSRNILHPGVKIIPQARNKNLSQAIEDLVGIEAKVSQLNLKKFQDFSYLFSGVCSVCSSCADICPIFNKLADEFSARSEAAPTFKRALAIAVQENNGEVEKLKKDPLFEKIFDLCLLCGQCTYKCPTNASMRDMVIKIKEENKSKFIVPMAYLLRSNPGMYQFAINLMGLSQGLWNNKLSRTILSALPEAMLPTKLPKQRVLPKFAKSTIRKRFPELVNLAPAKADLAYFYGCSSDLFEEPIVESFIKIGKLNNWKVSLPEQICCGEPFAAMGNTDEYHKLARYNIDQLADYKYIVAHCPSCLLAFKEYARDFGRIGDEEYKRKAETIVNKLYEPAQYIMEVIGIENLKPPTQEINQKVTIHLSCHEKLGQQKTATTNYTRGLLKLIPGLEIVEMDAYDDCCGLGGPWGLANHYDLSLKLREEKIENIIKTEADSVLSWCFGCMIQMRDGLNQKNSDIETKHPLELLGEAYEA